MAFDMRTGELSLLATFAGWAMTEEVQRRLTADGHGDLRVSDGVVFQRLVDGPSTVTALAETLGVTQQAASKAVADLEHRGYVRRGRDPADARARRLVLTGRGTDAVERARLHRAALDAELAERLGPRRVAAARALLADVVEALGADTAVAARRVRPPR
jgi:DNA-binding MarR family transcriptional regulator